MTVHKLYASVAIEARFIVAISATEAFGGQMNVC